MGDYITVNILDMIDAMGEETVNSILSDFSCPLNLEIDDFVKNKAVDFAKKKLSITYCVMDAESGDIVSIFALTHKALEISSEALSASTKKKLNRFGQFDETNHSYTVSAFLIAQFGKNYAVEQPEGWNGTRLMDKTFEILEKVQREIGGGVVYLECEEKQNLLDFYQNQKNNFRQFDVRYSDADATKYIQLFRFL